MNKFFNWLATTFICVCVFFYCIVGEFVLLFKNDND